MTKSVYIKVNSLRAKIVVGGWWWRIMRLVSPRTGAFTVLRTIYLKRSIQQTLADFPGNKRALKAAYGYLVAHEWGHVRQWEKTPYTFLPTYIGQVVAGTWRSIWGNAKMHNGLRKYVEVLTELASLGFHMRDGYHNAPLEMEAKLYAKRYAKAWTERLDRIP